MIIHGGAENWTKQQKNVCSISLKFIGVFAIRIFDVLINSCIYKKKIFNFSNSFSHTSLIILFKIIAYIGLIFRLFIPISNKFKYSIFVA